MEYWKYPYLSINLHILSFHCMSFIAKHSFIELHCISLVLELKAWIILSVVAESTIYLFHIVFDLLWMEKISKKTRRHQTSNQTIVSTIACSGVATFAMASSINQTSFHSKGVGWKNLAKTTANLSLKLSKIVKNGVTPPLSIYQILPRVGQYHYHQSNPLHYQRFSPFPTTTWCANHSKLKPRHLPPLQFKFSINLQ